MRMETLNADSSLYISNNISDVGHTSAVVANVNMTTAHLNESSSGITYLPYESNVLSGEALFRVVMVSIVMFFTLIGNTTLILLIMCYPRQRRKRVNIFLVNLAIADLMVCLFTMTTEILFVAFGEWVMGGVACKLVVYAQVVTLASTTFLLTGMSVDRYQVLARPLRSLTGRPTIWRKVLAAWLTAFVVAMPQLLIFVQTDEGVYPDGSIRHMCVSQGYTQPWQRKVYFSFMSVYVLLIPASIMSFCYIKIIQVVWKRTNSATQDSPSRRRAGFITRTNRARSSPSPIAQARFTTHHSEPTPRRNQSTDMDMPSPKPRARLIIPKKLIMSSKRKVVKMTLSVIVGFLACWTPYFVISLIRIYSDYRMKLSEGLAVAEIMALVHSALNPLLYGIFSVRMSFAGLCRLLRCSKQPPPLDQINDEPTTESDATWSDFRNLSIDFGARRETCSTKLRKLCSRFCCCSCEKEQFELSKTEVVCHELVPTEELKVPVRVRNVDAGSTEYERSPQRQYGTVPMTVVFKDQRSQMNGNQRVSVL